MIISLHFTVLIYAAVWHLCVEVYASHATVGFNIFAYQDNMFAFSFKRQMMIISYSGFWKGL